MHRIDVDILGRPAFSVVKDGNGLYRYDGLNAALAAQSGLSKATFVDHLPEECMPPDSVPAVIANYRRCFENGVMAEYEERIELPAGVKWWRTTLSPVLDGNGTVVQILGLCVDITERKLAELELRSVAFQDPLTGVCNRRRFEDDLENAVIQAKQTGRPFTVVMADVDRFKPINDTHGHAVGDEVLKVIAGRLARGIRATDRLARIGGDEFAAIITAASEGAIAVALDRMRRSLAEPIRIGAQELVVRLSLGAALWQPGMTTSDVTSAADAAMYRAKEA